MILTLGFTSVAIDCCRNEVLDGWQRVDLPTLLSVVPILDGRGEVLIDAQFQEPHQLLGSDEDCFDTIEADSTAKLKITIYRRDGHGTPRPLMLPLALKANSMTKDHYP